MAIFLVDYENVGNTCGLKGVEYLLPEDELYIFYSQCCKKLRKELMQTIYQSGSGFHICKLKETGKNALDFYIAAQTGECFATEGVTELAIISKDKGFRAVVDFWKIKDTSGKHRVILADTLENAILKTTDQAGKERRRLIADRIQMVDIEVEYARREEKNRIRSKLTEAFYNTGYESRVEQVLELINERQPIPSKELYRGALHQFGRAAGCEIYRILKAV